MSQEAVYHVQDFHFDYYCIIPQKNSSQILLLSQENGWNLPHFVPYEHHFGMVGHINQEIKAQLELDVTVLRCIYENYSLETRKGSRVYEMEKHSYEEILPANAHWVAFQELNNLTFIIPQIKQILESYFIELNSNIIPDLRVPWAKIGWFEQAITWINLKCDRLRIKTINPIKQIKSQTRSCLLTVNTTTGKLYFKAVAGIFEREPIFTQHLAQFYGDRVPKLIAIDTQKKWMLMREFDGKLLSQVQDISQWEKAIKQFAQMQIQTINRIDEFIKISFPHRKLNQLLIKMELLLTNVSVLLISQQNPRLSKAEIEKLSAMLPLIQAMCNELAVCGIPPTLIHGDLWSSNIIVNDKKSLFFDWSDAAISHPFFDAVFFLQDIEEELPNIIDVRVRLRHAYLEPWTFCLPMEQLIQIFEKIEPLTYADRAMVSYEIVQNLETSHRWETEEEIFYYLKMFLKKLK